MTSKNPGFLTYFILKLRAKIMLSLCDGLDCGLPILTLIIQFFHVGFLMRHKTVKDGCQVLHCAADWVVLMVLKTGRCIDR